MTLHDWSWWPFNAKRKQAIDRRAAATQQHVEENAQLRAAVVRELARDERDERRERLESIVRVLTREYEEPEPRNAGD